VVFAPPTSGLRLVPAVFAFVKIEAVPGRTSVFYNLFSPVFPKIFLALSCFFRSFSFVSASLPR